MNCPMRLGVSPAVSTPTDFYSQGFWGFSFPHWNPGLCGLSGFRGVPPSLSAYKHGTAGTAWTTSHCLACPIHHLAACPIHPDCPSLPLLPVRMNVSSLTPWLSDSIQFDFVSFLFFFFNLLLSFFWLCNEAQHIYLTPPSWPEVARSCILFL